MTREAMVDFNEAVSILQDVVRFKLEYMNDYPDDYTQDDKKKLQDAWVAVGERTMDKPTYIALTAALADYLTDNHMMMNGQEGLTYQETDSGDVSYTEESQGIFNTYLDVVCSIFDEHGIEGGD